MAIIGAASVAHRKTAILPEGGRDFLRRRMMELVGTAVAGLGVVVLLALFTYSPGDPSLNHATGRAPHNLMGVPGAYISDLLLQTFGLAIVLVPVALITWGVRMVRTHHLGFFGLRLSLLLLALLMMSVACVGLGDVGAAATHAGPGGLVGLALVGRFRELVLTHSSGGSLALIEPACAALAFIAMAPALGMNRTDLPLIFRILRAPFLGGVWLVRAGISLWRGKPQSLNDEPDMPAPPIGYAEIPGEIDASQYDPAHFPPRFEQIPEEGAPLPARDSLMVDAPYAPIERPADEIPEMPARPPAAARRRRRRNRCRSARCSTAWPACASSRSWAACAPPRRPPSAWSRSPRRLRRAPEPTSGAAARERGRRRQSVHARRSCRPGVGCRRGRRHHRAAQVGRGPGQARRQGRPARARSRDRRIQAAAARHPVAALARQHRDQDRRGGAGAERAPAGDRARRFRREGPDRQGAPGPGRHALRAGARARHQVEPRHRPRRRHRPLDERGIGARRHRARPQRHRHRAAQCTARDGVPARAAVDPPLRGQPPRPAAGAGQGHRRRSGDRRPRAHAASADRRHHRLGQVGGGQHHDPVAALPAAAGSLPLHHDRSEDAGAQRLRRHPASADARRHRAAQGDRGAEVGGARDGGPLPRHELDSACATSRATTSGSARPGARARR